MKQVSIRARLWRLVISLLVLVATSALALMWQLQVANQRLSTIYNDRVLPMQQLKVAADSYSVKLIEVATKVYVQQILPEHGQQMLAEQRQRMDGMWAAYLATDLLDSEKELIQRIEGLKEAAQPRLKELDSILTNYDMERMSAFIEYRLFPTVTPLAKAFDELIDIQTTEAQAAYEHANADYQRLLAVSAAVLLAAIALALWTGRRLIRAIIEPLNEAVQVAETVARGDLTAHISHQGNDEVGRLLSALRTMNSNLSRQALLPVGRHQTAVLDQGIHVRSQTQGHHVGIQAVDHRAGLLARAAMRLLDRHILTGLGLPVLGEGLVVLHIQLARRVVGDIQQRHLLLGQCGESRQSAEGQAGQKAGKQGKLDKVAAICH